MRPTGFQRVSDAPGCAPPFLQRFCARVASALLVLSCLSCKQAPEDENAARDSAQQTFTTVCARCHGSDGKGGVAPEGSNAPRNFCDAAFQASRSDDQLKEVIRKGKGGMPPFGSLFPDPVLTELVKKIRSFDPNAKRH